MWNDTVGLIFWIDHPAGIAKDEFAREKMPETGKVIVDLVRYSLPECICPRIGLVR